MNTKLNMKIGGEEEEDDDEIRIYNKICCVAAYTLDGVFSQQGFCES